jgi:GTP1/Obg family GTP-binding protein
MPDRATVYRWLLEQPQFCDMYTRAREEQADTLADEIIAIADESPEINEVRDKHGDVVDVKIDSGYVAYQKQRIEARKWTAMKLKPKKYGDKLELAGDPNNPMKVEIQSEADTYLAALLKNVELNKQVSANE